MSRKLPPIRYTSRDFDSIRNDLINYSKKYYPETHQDFSEGSFGSLMIDTVAYVGDIMSYYLDYQTNESFLDTSTEYDNVLKLGAGLGYKPKTTTSAVGVVSIYVSLPANSQGTSYDSNYLPVIKKGSIFQASNGNTFTLIDDVYITPTNSTIRKSRINDNAPYEYVAKVYGKVVSGVEQTSEFIVGDFQKFRKLLIGDQNITEILSVVDAEGSQYYEVDFLTQNVVYRSVPNTGEDKADAPNLLKPFSVTKRFVVIKEKNETYIQFGGSADEATQIRKNKILDPSNLVLNVYGKDYTTDESFDPSLLTTSDKLGAAPVNTTITVTYRRNPTLVSSAPARSVNRVVRPIISFENQENLSLTVRSNIASSITVENENPIVGQTDDFTSDELKSKIYGTFAAQNRAVTAEDYKALCYNMPGKFGSIKRASVMRDANELKRNLNLYVVSQDSTSNLVATTTTAKNNLKTWLSKNKIINDTIDILDAYIVNFGIYFTAIADRNFSKYDVLANSLTALNEEFATKLDIGESIQIARVYDALRGVDGLLDVRTITITQKTQTQNPLYSAYTFNFDDNLTADGLFLKVPKNVIMEIKFPDTDIEGKII